MRIILSAILILTLTALAPAGPKIIWDMVPAGTNLYGYTFSIDGNDGLNKSFFANVTFQGVSGATVNQVQYNGSVNVDTSANANSYNGTGTPPYNKLIDSYFNSSLVDVIVLSGNAPGNTLYHIEAGSGGGSAYLVMPLAQVVANGPGDGMIKFTGSISRNGVNYTIGGMTKGGDATFDGMVNVDDLGILASNYDGTVKTWATGDFSGDRIVNVDDLGILASGYDWVYAGSPAPLPEPASLVLLGLGLAGLLRRRR